MSEVVRTTKEVQMDHNNTLFRLGVASRAVQEAEREIKMLGETLDTLRLEYHTLLKQEQVAAEAAAKAKAEAAAEAAPPASGAV